MPLCMNTEFSRIFASLLIFTVFYHIKCEFRELAKTYGFYRVIRESGPKKDPKMDP